MKKIIILITLSFITFTLVAQQSGQRAEYNVMGDEFMLNLNFDDAKVYFQRGVDGKNCDKYSIEKLTFIWKTDTSMQVSMHGVMVRCLKCLNDYATQYKDSASIALLVDYYSRGIGTSVDKSKAEYWQSQLNILREPYIGYGRQNSSKLPREKVETEFFAGYSGSIIAPYGLTAGFVSGAVGGYLRFRTNMSFQSYTETCGTDGSIIGLEGSYSNPLGNEKSNSMMGTVGLIIKATPSFYISVGGGLWKYESIHEIEKVSIRDGSSEGKIWAKSEYNSYSGAALDLDGTFRIGKNFYFSVGGSVLDFKYIYANAGIGVFFK